MKKIFSLNGFYAILIPVFFVLHGYYQNFGLIQFRDCLLLLGTYLLAVLLIYVCSWLGYSSREKAALLTAAIISFYLFYGAMRDFLKDHFHLLSKYSIFAPLVIIFFIGLIIFLKKRKQNLTKLTLFLNSLLLIYIAVDGIGISWLSLHPNSDKLSIYGAANGTGFRACDTCKNPDIYFLLFDEYTSSANLRQVFHYDNSALDSFLVQAGFSDQYHSHSNYNFTPFSMASILNMNYIKGIKNINACTLEDYAKCNSLIRNNEVIRFLSSRNYDIVNYSIFDLAGNPSVVQSSLLPVKTKLITGQTFYPRMMRDIGWNLFVGRFEIKWLSRFQLYENLENNNKILALVKQETLTSSARPKFVYAHLEMPHPPFYFDKNLKQRSRQDLMAEKNGGFIESYKGYLPYTNSKLKELVELIQKNTNHSAVIILMGDHGFRIPLPDSSRAHHFKNLNAVYFPQQDYHLLTDTMNSVNQFRVIFNTLFKQDLPLLADSTISLSDQR